jgi:hypothetical protein
MVQNSLTLILHVAASSKVTFGRPGGVKKYSEMAVENPVVNTVTTVVSAGVRTGSSFISKAGEVPTDLFKK